jgi:UDP-N-acetylmuramyl pentapeptide phosphotransferase/UDP-N-acetylglucosamine-1-phosphate transferase
MFQDPTVYVISCAAMASVLCVLILWSLLKTGLAWRLAIDVPNERSLHTLPTPRVGGWGVVPVVALLTIVLAPSLWLAALLFALLAALSQIDDRRGLPVGARFGAHIAAVAIFVAAHPAAAPWWALCGVAFLMVWLVNLYNFMDGSDGLAGGMALFGFGAYAIAALRATPADIPLALAAALTAGTALGFLMFNFHPARIFLGDAGSIPLGFLAGALGYWGWAREVWPIWFPPSPSRRKNLASASRALLSAHGANGVRSRAYGAYLVFAHGRRHNGCLYRVILLSRYAVADGRSLDGDPRRGRRVCG